MKPRLFYRQKYILGLLKIFNKKLDKMSFQKYLFLLTSKQKEPIYDFIPYHYGPFSFQSYKDINFLKDNSFIEEEDNSLRINIDFNEEEILKRQDLLEIQILKSDLGDYSKDQLVDYVYKEFPYYTQKSRIKKYFRPQETDEYILYTVGYEGKSVDFYFNQLIKNQVKLLIDVRNNPISRKYGFSKKNLGDLLNRIGISYVHIPELGIISGKRQELITKKDYLDLFDIYKRTVLVKQKQALKKVIDLLRENKKVALTCFEADPEYCHRYTLGQKIFGLVQDRLELKFEQL